MTLMTWEDRFELGVTAMDSEHRTLINLMNDLHAYCETGRSRDAQRKALQRLASFTRKHFEQEEHYMETLGYPGLERHKGHHRKLLHSLEEHIQHFEDGGELGGKLFSFLRFWLAAHICGIDKKYGEHAATKDTESSKAS